MYLLIDLKEERGFIIPEATQLAEALSISKHTVYSWNRVGTVPFIYNNPTNGKYYIIVSNPEEIKSKRGGLREGGFKPKTK